MRGVEKLFSFRWQPFAVDPDVDYSLEFRLQEADGGGVWRKNVSEHSLPLSCSPVFSARGDET